jgi:hypothetical protein
MARATRSSAASQQPDAPHQSPQPTKKRKRVSAPLPDDQPVQKQPRPSEQQAADGPLDPAHAQKILDILEM